MPTGARGRTASPAAPAVVCEPRLVCAATASPAEESTPPAALPAWVPPLLPPAGDEGAGGEDETVRTPPSPHSHMDAAQSFAAVGTPPSPRTPCTPLAGGGQRGAEGEGDDAGVGSPTDKTAASPFQAAFSSALQDLRAELRALPALAAPAPPELAGEVTELRGLCERTQATVFEMQAAIQTSPPPPPPQSPPGAEVEALRASAAATQAAVAVLEAQVQEVRTDAAELEAIRGENAAAQAAIAALQAQLAARDAPAEEAAGAGSGALVRLQEDVAAERQERQLNASLLTGQNDALNHALAELKAEVEALKAARDGAGADDAAGASVAAVQKHPIVHEVKKDDGAATNVAAKAGEEKAAAHVDEREEASPQTRRQRFAHAPHAPHRAPPSTSSWDVAAASPSTFAMLSPDDAQATEADPVKLPPALSLKPEDAQAPAGHVGTLDSTTLAQAIDGYFADARTDSPELAPPVGGTRPRRRSLTDRIQDVAAEANQRYAASGRLGEMFGSSRLADPPPAAPADDGPSTPPPTLQDEAPPPPASEPRPAPSCSASPEPCKLQVPAARGADATPPPTPLDPAAAAALPCSLSRIVLDRAGAAEGQHGAATLPPGAAEDRAATPPTPATTAEEGGKQEPDASRSSVERTRSGPVDGLPPAPVAPRAGRDAHGKGGKNRERWGGKGGVKRSTSLTLLMPRSMSPTRHLQVPAEGDGSDHSSHGAQPRSRSRAASVDDWAKLLSTNEAFRDYSPVNTLRRNQSHTPASPWQVLSTATAKAEIDRMALEHKSLSGARLGASSPTLKGGFAPARELSPAGSDVSAEYAMVPGSRLVVSFNQRPDEHERAADAQKGGGARADSPEARPLVPVNTPLAKAVPEGHAAAAFAERRAGVSAAGEAALDPGRGGETLRTLGSTLSSEDDEQTAPLGAHEKP
eukprot:TRINITY_DN981_c0_g1_i2.p1 TRINITY_DN981_c0_g1~~TRINITY_DN981_c0_g1_i2.p1  ORF type:complete len:925 (+),score=334.71 TRINITY_DN981_c0_g1_i2:903-3677(+)